MNKENKMRITITGEKATGRTTLRRKIVKFLEANGYIIKDDQFNNDKIDHYIDLKWIEKTEAFDSKSYSEKYKIRISNHEDPSEYIDTSYEKFEDLPKEFQEIIIAEQNKLKNEEDPR